MTIYGEILFAGEMENVGGAAVHVYLEDVSRLDAASLLISEYHIESLPASSNTSERIPFELEAMSNGRKTSCSIRVHVDIDRDGKVSAGDYITMESFPVLDFESPGHHTVKVRKVI